MSKTDEYRAKALECERMAGVARDPEMKRRLQDIAFEWLEMADIADKHKIGRLS